MTWASAVQSAIIGNNPDLKVEFNHTLCSLGQFLYGEDGRKAAADNPQLASIIEEIKIPHEKLHQHGENVAQFLASGDQPGAARYFEQQVVPTLRKTSRLVRLAGVMAASALDGQKKAHRIFGKETQQHLNHVQKLMHSVNQTVEASIISDTQMIASAVGTRNGISLIGVVALIIGLGFAYLISRSITKPLHRAFAVVAQYGKGDTHDQDLPLGAKVNCSSLNSCGQQECPSFGTEGHCWVETGTFGPNPICFKLTNGTFDDCRECKVYRARDEITELGSVLVGMAKSLQGRSELAEAIARGDLTQEVKVESPRDQLGNALKTMMEGLREMVGGIQIAGEQIASGSGQVADASQALSQGATESASSLEEVSASMNQMAGQVRASAEHASAANQLSSESQAAAEKGDRQMTEMVSAMNEINQAGQNISKIIKVIDEIAFQPIYWLLMLRLRRRGPGSTGRDLLLSPKRCVIWLLEVPRRQRRPLS